MCGIVGYIGNKKVKAEQLLLNAHFNSYRGNDGIGVIYKENNKMVSQKFLIELEEAVTKKLYEDKATIMKQIGSIKMAVVDADEYIKLQSKFGIEMDKLHKVESNTIFVHHRKGTYGADTVKNLHPIEYDGKYYIHNGTAYGVDTVKHYLKLYEGLKFTSETDTEVLAVLYNKLKDKYKTDKKLFEVFSDMVAHGWGVLIEITKDGIVTIIKDRCRSLWVYEMGDGIYIISEPTPYIKKYNKLLKVSEGIHHANNNVRGFCYTHNGKKVNNWWNKGIQNDDVKYNTKCDICGTHKTVLNTSDCDSSTDYFEYYRQDICYECMVCNDKKEDVDDVIEYKNKCSQFLG